MVTFLNASGYPFLLAGYARRIRRPHRLIQLAHRGRRVQQAFGRGSHAGVLSGAEEYNKGVRGQACEMLGVEMILYEY